MSIISDPYISPGRISGVFRYLLKMKGLKENRHKLECILSPQSLSGSSRDMIKHVINESISMNLLYMENDFVMINPALLIDIKLVENIYEHLPDILEQLIFDPRNDKNYDLARSIAWFLIQDIYFPSGTWKNIEKSPAIGVLRNIGLNDTRYTQLEDWICYLGYGWTFDYKGSFLQSDPTKKIKKLVRDYFWTNSGEEVALSKILQWISEKCPVFEDGRFRNEMEKKLENRPERHLSSSTSHAWFRLQDENFIKLYYYSDAESYIFTERDDHKKYSHVRWLGKNEE